MMGLRHGLIAEVDELEYVAGHGQSGERIHGHQLIGEKQERDD